MATSLLEERYSYDPNKTTFTVTQEDHGRLFGINTLSAARTMTLPESPWLGLRIEFFDLIPYFSTNNLTIAQATSNENIMGADSNYTISTQGFFGGVMFVGGSRGWTVYGG